MARKRKSSTLEDITDLVAMLPWWAGVALALAAYLGLHTIASRPAPVVQTAPQMIEAATAAIWHGAAAIGQYVLPLICLAGAAISAARRRRRNTLFNATSASASADALQGMTWQEFEILVGEGFRRRGYSVKEIGGGGPDGGVDLVLTKGSEKFLVQCKQWRAFKVGVATVRELYGVMAADGATGGFVVTSGRFTPDAVAFAAGRNIELIDGPVLMEMLRSARTLVPQPKPPSVQPRRDAPHQVARVEPTFAIEPAALLDPTEAACPRCGKPMVRRMAKRGELAGKAFLGCSAFSEGCRGIREIAGTA